MYAINVFVTFSLTLLGMVRHEIAGRGTPGWMPQARARPRRLRPLRLDPRRHRLREVRGGRLADGPRHGLARRPWPSSSSATTCACASSCAGSTTRCCTFPMRPHEEPQTPIPRDEPVAVMLVSRVFGPRHPHGAVRPESLPAPVQELPVRLGGRHRLLPLQGRRGARGPQEADDRRPARSTWTSPTGSDFARRCATRSGARRSRRSSSCARRSATSSRARSSTSGSSSSRTTSSTTGSCTTRPPSRSSAGSSSRVCRRSCFRSACWRSGRPLAQRERRLVGAPRWRTGKDAGRRERVP